MVGLACILFAFIIGSVTTGCVSKTGNNTTTAQEFEATSDKYDGPDNCLLYTSRCV